MKIGYNMGLFSNIWSNNEMSHTWHQCKLRFRPKIPIFQWLTSFYFVSFFFEHPVHFIRLCKSCKFMQTGLWTWTGCIVQHMENCIMFCHFYFWKLPLQNIASYLVIQGVPKKCSSSLLIQWPTAAFFLGHPVLTFPLTHSLSIQICSNKDTFRLFVPPCS